MMIYYSQFMLILFVFFFKQKTAYEMRISDWSSDVCSSDLPKEPAVLAETTGTIKFGPGTKGKQRVKIVRTDGSEAEILVPKWVEIRVFEGETVEQGEIMSDGEPSPHDSLRLQGRSEERRGGKECVHTGRSRWSPVP